MLTIEEGLVRETLLTLEKCGDNQNECVVFWLARRTEPEHIRQVVHPAHRSGLLGYEVDPQWMHRLWVDLPDAKMTLRAQIHTHPDAAFHSETDDRYPAVQAEGFVSIVVPHFAASPVDVSQIHVSILEAGGWRRSNFEREISVA